MASGRDTSSWVLDGGGYLVAGFVNRRDPQTDRGENTGYASSLDVALCKKRKATRYLQLGLGHLLPNRTSAGFLYHQHPLILVPSARERAAEGIEKFNGFTASLFEMTMATSVSAVMIENGLGGGASELLLEVQAT